MRRVRAHEHERAPRVDSERHEADAVAVEPGLLVAARRGAERPVELVRPGVVRALERLPPSLSLAEERAPVAADVQERPQLAAAVAHDHDRDVAGPGRDEPAGLGDLVGPRRVLPEPAKDALVLEPKDVRVGVPAPGQRPRPGSRRPRQPPLKP